MLEVVISHFDHFLQLFSVLWVYNNITFIIKSKLKKMKAGNSYAIFFILQIPALLCIFMILSDCE